MQSNHCETRNQRDDDDDDRRHHVYQLYQLYQFRLPTMGWPWTSLTPDKPMVDHPSKYFDPRVDQEKLFQVRHRTQHACTIDPVTEGHPVRIKVLRWLIDEELLEDCSMIPDRNYFGSDPDKWVWVEESKDILENLLVEIRLFTGSHDSRDNLVWFVRHSSANRAVGFWSLTLSWSSHSCQCIFFSSWQSRSIAIVPGTRPARFQL